MVFSLSGEQFRMNNGGEQLESVDQSGGGLVKQVGIHHMDPAVPHTGSIVIRKSRCRWVLSSTKWRSTWPAVASQT